MKKFNYIIAAFFILALAIIPLTIYQLQQGHKQSQDLRTRASASTTLYFMPATTAANPLKVHTGTAGNLDLWIDPGNNLPSIIKLELLFDAAKIQLDSFLVNQTAFPATVEGPIINNGTLKITVSIGSDPTKAIQSPTKVGTLNFTALSLTGDTPSIISFGANTSVLSIAQTDQAGQNVLSTTTPGFVEIATPTTTGTMHLRTTLDGQPWNGKLWLTVKKSSDPLPNGNPGIGSCTDTTNAPQSYDAPSDLPQAAGVYTVWFCNKDGYGPPGAYLNGDITPWHTQTILSGGNNTWTFNFSTKPVTSNFLATLDGQPWNGKLWVSLLASANTPPDCNIATSITVPSSSTSISVGLPLRFTSCPNAGYGPPGATLTSITPWQTQRLNHGDSTNWVFNYTSTQTLTLTVYEHGIGASGDNTNPDSSLSNKNPSHLTRNITLSIFNTSNQFIASATGTITYNSTSGSFTGSIITDKLATTGDYLVKASTDFHLTRLLPGHIQHIIAGQSNKLSDAIFVAGDIVQDNKLNILDYNQILNCYSNLNPPVSCTDSQKQAADLNDDGLVNQVDYNLFLRELATQSGD